MILVMRLSTDIRQDQIAGAVAEIVAEEGLEALSMQEVARRVGVVPSALYRHYSGKQQMLLAAFKMLSRSFVEVLAQTQKDNDDMLLCLRKVMEEQRAMLPITIAIPRLVFGIPADANENILVPARDLINNVIRNLSQMVQQGQLNGQFRRELNPEYVAVCFWGILVSTALRWHIAGDDFDPAAYQNQAWQMFSRAVSVEPSNKGESEK
jgi:AcrR family transcriptional regulator